MLVNYQVWELVALSHVKVSLVGCLLVVPLRVALLLVLVLVALSLVVVVSLGWRVVVWQQEMEY